jgi:SAM-dependent methyltransferase
MRSLTRNARDEPRRPRYRFNGRLRAILDRAPRLILDTGRRLGDFSEDEVTYDVGLCKEEVARQHIFALQGAKLRFLDVGARDGRLDYLLGVHENLRSDPELYAANRARFDAKYQYWGLDLRSEASDGSVLVGDICSPTLLAEQPEFESYFDVIYSNNVFEHLRQPWLAAENLVRMLRTGGICVTIAPFSLRYHESPEDHFRFTHVGLASLFDVAGEVEVLVSGYDIRGRRNNWQGLGVANDRCPVDRFGAWRENWFVVCVVRRGGQS